MYQNCEGFHIKKKSKGMNCLNVLVMTYSQLSMKYDVLKNRQ